MAFASPTRSSPTLDRYLLHGSGSMGSHSPAFYANRPTKPKKFQSAHYDETTGTWRCKNCGYAYPNPEPHHHQRRAHKKTCEGGLSKVHRWLTLSTGEETEDSQDTSNVVDKPTMPEASDPAPAQRSLGQTDDNDGVRTPQLLDREFKFHETSSNNELPKESEIEELGDPKGILSDQSGLLASVENSEAQRKEELDSDPVTGLDFKPRTGDLGRLLTLNSDISLPREPSQDRSDKVDVSGVACPEFVPVDDDSTSGNKETRDIDMEEPLSRSGQNEAHSLKAGEDVLTADDALNERTKVAQGDRPEPSPDEHGRKNQTAGDLGEGFDPREPSLNAADNDTQEKKAEVLQEAEESQMTPTEDGNAQELNVEMGEGSGETEVIFPPAIDDGAMREKEEEVRSEQGITTISRDGTEYKSGDVRESSQLLRGVGNQEASQHATLPDQSSHLDHATQEVGDLDGRHEAEEVDAINLEPLSDDAEGVTETAPNASPGELSVKLSSAERNWDGWEHVVNGEDRCGIDKMPPLPEEIDDAGAPFSEDGLTSSQSDSLEDDAADKSAPTLESKGGAVLVSDPNVGNEIGFQPASLDWTLAFTDTLNNAVDKQPVESVESSTSADYHSIPDQDGPELISGLGQETDETNKVASRLSAAEANWDDWEDVIRSGPMLLKGITLGKTEDPESSGEYQTPQVDSLGDLIGLGQGTTDIVLESENVEGVIDTAAAEGLPVHSPESEKSDWLIDFSEPSVEDNSSGAGNEEVSTVAAVSSPKLEVPGTKFLDLLDLNEEASGQEQEESLWDGILVTPPQSETGQTSTVLSKLSSALRNWEDWDHVVRESERVSRPEETSPVLESDEGGDKLQNGLESPSRADSKIVDTGSSEPAGSVEPLKTPPVADSSNRASMNPGQEIDDLSHVKQADGMVTSVPEETDPLFRFPNSTLESNNLPKNLDFSDSTVGPREGGREVDNNKETSLYESGQAGEDNLWEDDWEVVQKNEYPPTESKHLLPSFEDAHDGELSSDHEFPNDLPTAVNLPSGKRRWADWEDLTRSEYMVLDGPDGESLVFKRSSDVREKVAAKSRGGRRESSPSLEEPDDDGGSPSLRRTRRQPSSFDDDRSQSLKGALPRGVVKSDYSAGSTSFQGFETTSKSLPASSPRKSESGDVAPLVTRRPLVYRGSRRDYASEVEDMDVTSEPPLDQRLHHHNQHEHEDALKYDVEKVLRGQTTYELICPICGAVITRKIIIRKKRRFTTEGDPRWRRGPSEITPIEDDGNQSPRSDVSSEIEDVSGAWKQGIRPCFGYFFGS